MHMRWHEVSHHTPCQLSKIWGLPKAQRRDTESKGQRCSAPLWDSVEHGTHNIVQAVRHRRWSVRRRAELWGRPKRLAAVRRPF